MTPPAHTATTTSVRATAALVLARYPADLGRRELLARVCRDEGIELLDADSRDIAGVLRREEGRWHIYLSRQDAPQRRLFTLAHLLGHYFLHAAAGDTFVESPFVPGGYAAPSR